MVFFALAKRTIWLERIKQGLRSRDKVTDVAEAKSTGHYRDFGFYKVRWEPRENLEQRSDSTYILTGTLC